MFYKKSNSKTKNFITGFTLLMMTIFLGIQTTEVNSSQTIDGVQVHQVSSEGTEVVEAGLKFFHCGKCFNGDPSDDCVYIFGIRIKGPKGCR